MVEVIGFSEEEGVRFGSGYLGSKGYAGRLGRAELRLRDPDGLSVRGGSFQGGERTLSPPVETHRRRELLGYLEVHIEQGPVLEARRLAAGVVSAIAGQTRCQVNFGGAAGHPGTTPITLRKDALAGAAEFILEVKPSPGSRKGLVATVGRIAAKPGAANVIPASVELSLDVRHAADAERRRTLASIRRLGAAWPGDGAFGLGHPRPGQRCGCLLAGADPAPLRERSSLCGPQSHPDQRKRPARTRHAALANPKPARTRPHPQPPPHETARPCITGTSKTPSGDNAWECIRLNLLDAALIPISNEEGGYGHDAREIC